MNIDEVIMAKTADTEEIIEHQSASEEDGVQRRSVGTCGGVGGPVCLLRTAPGQQQRSDGLPERGNREEQSCSGSHPDHYHLLPDNSGSNIRGSVATVEYLGTWYSECFK